MNSPIIFTLSKNYLPSKMSGEICVSETSLNMSRKRRLDHLSWEEKLQRKKLKNRVAAQTSRDRKKAKIDEMDDRLNLLEKKNVKLSEEMRSLKELNERLMKENREMRERLGCARGVSGAAPSGPAVSPPLLQEGLAPPAPRARPLPLALCQLAMLCLLCKISSHRSTRKSISTVLSSLPTAYSEKLIQKLLNQIQLNRKVVQKTDSLHQKWWGPHQSTWNPMELKA